MENVADCKNGKTRLICVDKCVKTIDSARKECDEKPKEPIIKRIEIIVNP